jgi:hypothetical protein
VQFESSTGDALGLGNAQRKAITDLAERQWKAQKKAIEDAQNVIGVPT